MEDKKYNRRTVLGSIGVGASALATLPGMSVANPDHREEVLEHEGVQRILDELDNPEITGAIREISRSPKKNREILKTTRGPSETCPT